MLGTQEAVFRFADVEVREREFRLIKAGEVIPVEPKAFRVLLFLLHNPQKLITKEELLNAVWGETAVSENSLTRSIALLRRLLGEDTHEPRFIETVATVGYRFVCSVEVSEDTHGRLESPNSALVGNGGEPAQISLVAAGEVVPAKTPKKAAWTTRRQGLLAAIVLVVGLLGSAFWFSKRSLPLPRVTEYTQITHDGRWKWLAGTDGNRIYFGRWNDPPPTAEVAISGGEAVPIPIGLPPPGPWVFDVSPDGSALLVCSPNSIGGGLWSVHIPGGSLRHLTDKFCVALAAAWSPDGKSVVYSRQEGGIYIVRSDGSDEHKLGGLNEIVHDLAWSPDHRLIRFTMNHRIWEMSSDGSGLHELLPGWQPSSWQRSGRWTPDGRFFEFSVWDAPLSNYPNGAPYQFWLLDERRGSFRRTTKEPVQLTQGPIRWDRPIPSKDGKKIFSRGLILRGELVSYDPRSHQIQPFLGGISAQDVSFSPDGRFVAYVTFPDGILWKANWDGSSSIQLTTPPVYPISPRWSPDGAQILFFVSDSQGNRKSYIIPSQGGNPEPLFPEDKGQQGESDWSPDGRRIVFSTGGYGDPKSELRLLDLASHHVIALPGSTGMWSPRWSPNGRFVAGLDALSWDLKVFDFETQRWSVLQKGWTAYPTWTRNSQFIYFLRPLDEQGVYRVGPSGGHVEHVVDLKGFRYTGMLSFWIGLDPTDAPLLLRDTGSDDIYALTLEEK